MSTKLLAGLLAMVVVAGIGIYAGVSHFTAPTEGIISAAPEGSSCCQSSKAMLPVSAKPAVSCCSETHDEHEDEGCCASKAKSKTQFIAAFTGVAASTVEPKSAGCAKCKEDHCDEK